MYFYLLDDEYILWCNRTLHFYGKFYIFCSFVSILKIKYIYILFLFKYQRTYLNKEKKILHNVLIYICINLKLEHCENKLLVIFF